MKTDIKIRKEKYGWCIEVYYNGILIDWRGGLTKRGLSEYHKHYKKCGDLSAGTRHLYNPDLYK